MVMSIVKLLDTSGKNWIIAKRVEPIVNYTLETLTKLDYERGTSPYDQNLGNPKVRKHDLKEYKND